MATHTQVSEWVPSHIKKTALLHRYKPKTYHDAPSRQHTNTSVAAMPPRKPTDAASNTGKPIAAAGHTGAGTCEGGVAGEHLMGGEGGGGGDGDRVCAGDGGVIGVDWGGGALVATGDGEVAGNSGDGLRRRRMLRGTGCASSL